MGASGKLGLLLVCGALAAAPSARAEKPDLSVAANVGKPDAGAPSSNSAPARAEGDAPRWMTVSPRLPDTGTFDWLLLDLSRPLDGHRRGMTTSSATVAFSANAPLLAPPTKPGDAMILRNPALDATVGSVPAGSALFGLLAPQHPDVDSMQLRQVGKAVVEPGGLVERTTRKLLGTGPEHDYILDGIGAGVTAGLIAKLATARAQGLLGFDPSTHFKLLGGKLNQSFLFHCDPKFKNAGVDVGSQYHLLHTTSPRWVALVSDAYLEGGVTVQRGLGPGILPVRWGKLHAVNGRFDGGFGIYDPPAGPPSLTFDGIATIADYRLHFATARENGTGHLSGTSTLIRQLGPVEAGLYFGGRTSAPGAPDRGLTTGIVTMMVF